MFDRQWYQLKYNDDNHHFKFRWCDTPNLVARHSCTLAECTILNESQHQALQALLKPVIFGEKLAQRPRDAHVIDNKSFLTSVGGDYEELCKKLEQCTLHMKHQRDWWKDRFFYSTFDMLFFEDRMIFDE